MELTRIILENEMDLILAHKQAMKIAELCGLSLPGQTTFATAVSEVSRSLIQKDHPVTLAFQITPKSRNKCLTAVLETADGKSGPSLKRGLQYARKLVSALEESITEQGICVRMDVALAPSFSAAPEMMDYWKVILNDKPSISPYEEIKRKNKQLSELAERLKQSEEQYKVLTDSLPIMIYTFTVDGKVTYANKWMLDYVGSSIDELNRTRFRHVYHPDDYASIWERWETGTSKSNKMEARERKMRNVYGEYRWHAGVVIPILDSAGKPLYWNSYMVDIHAQKIMEETLKDNRELREMKVELEEKVDELARSNKLLEQFAFVTSHDLQEPLRKISFFSNYIKSNFLAGMEGKTILYLDKLVNESNRTRDLVKDILQYSTINASEKQMLPVDVGAVIDSVLSDMELTLKEKEASVHFAGLPTIEGNFVQLTQLFGNLISNAVKFVPSGTAPVVHIHAVYHHDFVDIFLKDNGIGIEDQFRDKIFELFQRLHPKDEFSGTGIGLAICKKIMDFHQGSISVESSPGKGSTFMLRFPYVAASSHSDTDPIEESLRL